MSRLPEHPTIRIGVLGAARITRWSLIGPARRTLGVEVIAIAARDRGRAALYARHHGIPRVHDSYDELLLDDRVDAVYIALPAALHARWAIAAIRSGKHVLVEKPFASNADAARLIETADAAAHVIVMEAYHSAYHPIHARLRTLIDDGMLGEIEHASASFHPAVQPGSDIRWNPALGGGALLDIGYYPVRMLRELFGLAPTVDSAAAESLGQIDHDVRATLTFEQGVTGRIEASMWPRRRSRPRLAIVGTQGSLSLTSPYMPQLAAVLRVRTRSSTFTRFASPTSTYRSQLEAFRNAITVGAPFPTGSDAAVQQLETIDAIYRRAGLQPRADQP